ncbi:MAG: hypothetical protein COY58_02260 [Gammaproteobacteria bacterium CG_4_10_14_0_8_um_filter_38_16]|nr:MAG: hypothetical protein COY58_02260 [Gammaproteobacteria bacterium CG_4_10_14_0_8_um_filter_38_16]PJA03758.1 MAG: hypothetical protein COX72_02420 [Gammaproteobacteria bacterium CG_4_10_14_0_2_um_filter_38_22]PJB10568.1 MAG: hypothetical protein CO120_04140 [Gammaproteobacteria bacterium CG_4_9_14_3_um_filter_38_9]
MMICNEINYPLYVVGRLVEIPYLRMDSKGELFAVIKLQTFKSPAKQVSVLLIGNQALKIRRYGFVGLPLLAKCDYCENLLVGNKLIFIDVFSPGSETQHSLKSDELTEDYLFQFMMH